VNNPVTIPADDWTQFGVHFFVRCPGCREKFRLDHEIKVDGTIVPSLDCPQCDFHAMARLENYFAPPPPMAPED
jgi:hypothetical protein